ncbi:uncharacterized protein LOC134536320 [Bacillus rossius redtenbacheri]|uniref:uncharacterized protein LOC134536320 n=1 Tax=Bacillus rossius redtenbacheri TaxID=93214 RepID=UPI002FDE859D
MASARDKEAADGPRRQLHMLRMFERENAARLRWYRGRMERGEHEPARPRGTPGLQGAAREAARRRAERYRAAAAARRRGAEPRGGGAPEPPLPVPASCVCGVPPPQDPGEASERSPPPPDTAPASERSPPPPHAPEVFPPPPQDPSKASERLPPLPDTAPASERPPSPQDPNKTSERPPPPQASEVLLPPPPDASPASEMFPPPPGARELLLAEGRPSYLAAAVQRPPHLRYRYPATENMRYGWDVLRLSALHRVKRQLPEKQQTHRRSGIQSDPDHHRSPFAMMEPWFQIVI